MMDLDSAKLTSSTLRRKCGASQDPGERAALSVISERLNITKSMYGGKDASMTTGGDKQSPNARQKAKAISSYKSGGANGLASSTPYGIGLRTEPAS